MLTTLDPTTTCSMCEKSGDELILSPRCSPLSTRRPVKRIVAWERGATTPRFDKAWKVEETEEGVDGDPKGYDLAG